MSDCHPVFRTVQDAPAAGTAQSQFIMGDDAFSFRFVDTPSPHPHRAEAPDDGAVVLDAVIRPDGSWVVA